MTSVLAPWVLNSSTRTSTPIPGGWHPAAPPGPVRSRSTTLRVAALAREPWACRQLYDDYAGRGASATCVRRARASPRTSPARSSSACSTGSRSSPVTSRTSARGSSPSRTASSSTTPAVGSVARRRPCSASTSRPTSTGDVEHEALANVGAEWADELLASLPPDQRAVVALRVTADLSLEQVADILGKRVGAVKSLQHRALESLRRRCEEVPA